MLRLKDLDENETAQVLAEVGRDNPELMGQFKSLVEGARRIEETKQAVQDDPRIQEVIGQAAKSPRIQHVAETLGQMGGGHFGAILNRLSSVSPALAEAIRQAMFSFDDLCYAENRGLQELLSRLDKKTLRYALRAAPEHVADHLYSQMSSRAASQMREDIEVMGRVRRSEVMEARQKITDEARKMLKAGELIVIKPGDSETWVR